MLCAKRNASKVVQIRERKQRECTQRECNQGFKSRAVIRQTVTEESSDALKVAKRDLRELIRMRAFEDELKMLDKHNFE